MEKHTLFMLTPLMWAGNVEVLKMLLDAGAKVDERDDYGQTPLMHAVQRHSVEVVKVLLEAGAKIDDQDNDGDTVLEYAIERGDEEMVQMLLDGTF